MQNVSQTHSMNTEVACEKILQNFFVRLFTEVHVFLVVMGTWRHGRGL